MFHTAPIPMDYEAIAWQSMARPDAARLKECGLGWENTRSAEEPDTKRTGHFYLGTAAAVGVAALVLTPFGAQAQGANTVAIDNDDIGGVVRGPSGPEAGVWVIAETRDLPTRFTRSVVTDDQGRYVLPDLPKAKYKIWVRGYGLIDSAKVDGEPGQQLNLTAVPAPNETAAAQYYPAIYWYSMMKIPDTDQFGGKSDIPANVTQIEWLGTLKGSQCIGCHQLGNLATRTIPKELGDFKNSEEAWMRRTQSGQAGEMMTNVLAGQLGGAPYRYLADWTDRVAKGELPHAKPPRPSGVERNIVVTTWDWSDDKHYLHDLIASDRRDPTVNAYGAIYGSPEYSTDNLPVLDPKTNTVVNYKAPVRDPSMPQSVGPGHAAAAKPIMPSAYWGNEQLWDTRVNNHNSVFDKQGRLWLAAAVRGLEEEPAFCRRGSDHPSAKLRPLARSGRQLAMLDPKTGKYTFVDTCFGTQHLNFALDADDTLWTSAGAGDNPVGWLNTEDVLGDRRCGEVTGVDLAHRRYQRQRQARRLYGTGPAARSQQGHAYRPDNLRRHAGSERWIDLGFAMGDTRRSGAD